MSDTDLSALADLLRGPAGATVTVLRGWVRATSVDNGLSTRDIETRFGPLPEFATIDVTTEDGDALAAQVQINEQAGVRIVSVFFMDEEDERDVFEATDMFRGIASEDWWKKKVVVDLLAQSGVLARKKPVAKPKQSEKRRSTQQYTKVTPEHLVRVAEVYRSAYAAGKGPTQAVADEWNTTRSTASRWVYRAREEKVLGPADGNKAGEKA